jgi:alginate O-acetyltransferase complex protein AlgJ
VTAPEKRPRVLAMHEAWLPSEHPFHRPRHGGRQLTALISALVFFMVPVLVLVFGVRPAVFENRALATAPNPADGWEFFTALPAWANDHLPFRDGAVRAVDDVSRDVFGEPFPLGARPNGGQWTARPPPGMPPGIPAGPFAPSSVVPGVFPLVITGQNGWLYFGFDVEAKCAPIRPLDQTIDAVNRLRTAVEASGRQFVFVVAPDKSTVVPEFLPPDYPGRGCAQAGTGTFWSQITRRAGAVDLRGELGALAAHGDPVYHRLDTHWTDLGALLMTRALAERIQLGSTSTWNIKPTQTVQSGADLPRLIGRTGVNVYQEYSLAPSGDRDRTGPHVDDIRAPVLVGAGQVPGVVSEPVTMLADSFSESAARYVRAGFADVALVGYETAGSDPAGLAALLADRKVVVLEVVERNMASGVVPLLQPHVLNAITAELAARPLK